MINILSKDSKEGLSGYLFLFLIPYLFSVFSSFFGNYINHSTIEVWRLRFCRWVRKWWSYLSNTDLYGNQFNQSTNLIPPINRNIWPTKKYSAVASLVVVLVWLSKINLFWSYNKLGNHVSHFSPFYINIVNIYWI